MFRSAVFREYVKMETIPVIAITGLGLGMAGYHIYKLSQDPHVTWTNTNKYPWQEVKSNQSLKYMNVNEQLTEKYNRKWF